MKIYIEDDNGNKTELKELNEINPLSELLILTLERPVHDEALAKLAAGLKQMTNKKCIILGPEFGKVYGC
jgi:hypothetical protein